MTCHEGVRGNSISYWKRLSHDTKNNIQEQNINGSGNKTQEQVKRANSSNKGKLGQCEMQRPTCMKYQTSYLQKVVIPRTLQKEGSKNHSLNGQLVFLVKVKQCKSI